MPSKIFCIGFHRTGTRSIAEFLRSYGYAVIHNPTTWQGVDYAAAVRHKIHDREAVARVLDPVISAFEGFADVPFPALYDVLWERFPNSRFILTTRSMDSWWLSLVRQRRLDERPDECCRLSPFDSVQYTAVAGIPVSYLMLADEKFFKGLFQRHCESVRAFFEAKPGSLLTCDVTHPNANADIAAFLERSDTNEMPHIGAKRKVSLTKRFKRALRKQLSVMGLRKPSKPGVRS